MDAAAFPALGVRTARPNLQQRLPANVKTALGILLLWVVVRHVSRELPQCADGWTFTFTKFYRLTLQPIRLRSVHTES